MNKPAPTSFFRTYISPLHVSFGQGILNSCALSLYLPCIVTLIVEVVDNKTIENPLRFSPLLFFFFFTTYVVSIGVKRLLVAPLKKQPTDRKNRLCFIILIIISATMHIYGICLTSFSLPKELSEPIQLLPYLLFILLAFLVVATTLLLMDIIKNFLKNPAPISNQLSTISIAMFLTVQSFALIYLWILACNPDALCMDKISIPAQAFWDCVDNSKEAPLSNQSAFYFEILYFSAMTFMVAGCAITPISVLAKLFVVAEVFTFVILVSVFALNLLAHKNANNQTCFCEYCKAKQSSRSLDSKKN